MNYNILKKLPDFTEIKNHAPLKISTKENIAQHRSEVKNILTGKDNRILLIIGPCSAWPEEAVLIYADKLLALEKKVNKKIKIVMRVYIQKPRTTKGWIGPIIQADPFKKPDLVTGLKYSRKMMIDVVDKGLAIADEALSTHNADLFLELLSWVAIGARSSEDQEHRIFASAIECAVGLKNPTHGSLKVSVNSIVAAQHHHTAHFDGYEVETKGNPYAHLVLRGSNNGPNFSNENLIEVKKFMTAQNIKNPAVIIDTSHDNCLINGKKNHLFQINNMFEILNNIKNQHEIKKLVKGFMVESFLKDGNQILDLNKPNQLDLNGLSITDPCIGWEKTEEMILNLFNNYA
ncbi:3-deoxy-7-phosphoheptulonate synthase [Pigmentibacter sp. JX0631]|uniref:3-deoxy-7-phosphoheptulonate synthase n=1 Tax=Pigmentibacter sp. JX0631 TaxID=2976982 RepID=UPI00246859F1|nr:3-deoxy-7-phosphoheptulonate synthase [Pigmentibacter sp. JX0631]WGL60410.1 3-deoxy-7-phosphoheptulonate synthase [Pigmentibacter sp. JX0631]